MRHLPRVFRIKSGQFFKLYPEFIPHHFSILYFWPVLNEETQSFQLRLFTHEKKTKKKCWMNQSKKISQIFVYHFPLNCLRDIETDDPVMRTIETVLFLEKLPQDAENKFFFYFQDPADLTFDSHFFLFGVFFSHHLVIRIEIKRHYGPKFVNERNNFLCFLPTWFVHNAHVLFLDITLVRWLCVCVCFQLSNK